MVLVLEKQTVLGDLTRCWKPLMKGAKKIKITLAIDE